MKPRVQQTTDGGETAPVSSKETPPVASKETLPVASKNPQHTQPTLNIHGLQPFIYMGLSVSV